MTEERLEIMYPKTRAPITRANSVYLPHQQAPGMVRRHGYSELMLSPSSSHGVRVSTTYHELGR
jgi:hypothetical protein